MLYRPAWASAEPVRYQQLPLRVSQQVLNEYVESRPIRCTHFDAFRFFTPEARPLNVYAPQLGKREEAQPALEQPGSVRGSGSASAAAPVIAGLTCCCCCCCLW